MRNFDLSPLMRQWIGFDKLVPTHCKTPVKARASRRTTLRKATITTTALPSRWQVFVRKI
ncbi:Small heat shock protein B [Escherichia coli]|nr:Small heat shock protein B [Escherichia coli]